MADYSKITEHPYNPILSLISLLQPRYLRNINSVREFFNFLSQEQTGYLQEQIGYLLKPEAMLNETLRVLMFSRFTYNMIKFNVLNNLMCPVDQMNDEKYLSNDKNFRPDFSNENSKILEMRFLEEIKKEYDSQNPLNWTLFVIELLRDAFNSKYDDETGQLLDYDEDSMGNDENTDRQIYDLLIENLRSIETILYQKFNITADKLYDKNYLTLWMIMTGVDSPYLRSFIYRKTLKTDKMTDFTDDEVSAINLRALGLINHRILSISKFEDDQLCSLENTFTAFRWLIFHNSIENLKFLYSRFINTLISLKRLAMINGEKFQKLYLHMFDMFARKLFLEDEGLFVGLELVCECLPIIKMVLADEDVCDYYMESLVVYFWGCLFLFFFTNFLKVRVKDHF